MRRTYGWIICGLVFSASNVFADCDWVLWKSWSQLNPALISAIQGRQPMPQEMMLKKWEYLDAFQNKKECQIAREEKLDTFISARKAMLKKSMDEERANEEAAKNLHLPLDKRFPAFESYIDTQHALGRNDKDIESLILKQIAKMKKADPPREIRVNEDGSVYARGITFKFKCIPSTIDPRIKG